MLPPVPVRSSDLAIAVGLLATLCLGCATEADLAVARDLTAPFQSTDLSYTFVDEGDAWTRSVSFQYTNKAAVAVSLGGCNTLLQRRRDGTWLTVYVPVCPQSEGGAADSIPAGASVTISYPVSIPHDPNAEPRSRDAFPGVYRVVFDLRERQTPDPGLIVWREIADIDRRRSNEFAASLPR